jgi:hypothetical protein
LAWLLSRYLADIGCMILASAKDNADLYARRVQSLRHNRALREYQ